MPGAARNSPCSGRDRLGRQGCGSPGFAALRERAAQALRRHRAGRLVSDRGAGRSRARRHAVRQRRLADAGDAGPVRAARRCASTPTAGTRWRHHSAMLEQVFARAARVRRHPLPPRLPALPDARRCERPARDDHARPAGRRRSCEPLFRDLRRRRRWCRSPTRSARRCRSPTGAATVYHGLPLGPLPLPRRRAASYLAFLGRISPEKRVDRAIEIARRLGMPLKIAAKIDDKDRDYYESEIKPLFADPLVEFVGEIGEQREGRLPGQRGGAAVPDRLAGAVRPGDDRGDGLRHAGGRVSLRVGARGDARRRVRVRGRHASTRRWRRPRARVELPRASAAAPTSRGASRRRAWRDDYLAVYEALVGARAAAGAAGRPRAGGDRRRRRATAHAATDALAARLA